MLGVIRSELPLPLPAAVETPLLTEAWSITLAAPANAPTVEPSPTIRRDDDHVTMIFSELAVVRADLSTQTIEIEPSPRVDDWGLGVLTVDRIIPAIASDTCLVLHAGAVVEAADETAVLVVGASGSGKSTLVARWCLEGHRLLGDDTIRVDGAVAACSFVGPRLTSSSIRALGLDKGIVNHLEKVRLGSADGIALAESPATVRRIVLLGASTVSSPTLAAVKMLCEQAAWLGTVDPLKLIDRVTALVSAVPEIEVRPAWATAAN